MTFADLIAQFGTTAKDKLDGPGEREALLSGPVARLIEDLGAESGMKTVAHDEVREQDGSVRPDFGVRVNDVLVGHIELKAPGVSLDPESYGKTTHNYRQWQRLKELPNLLHTNGVEWRLWRYGELVDEPVSLHTPSLTRTRGKLTAPSRMEMLLNGFLRWEPAPISSVSKLVDTLAPLARMLREEVRLALKAERRAIKAGADPDLQPFLGIARDWRTLLFPHSRDEEFADGFSQTVVFALVLAVSDGIDISAGTLHDVARKLEGNYSLMGKALDLLTAHITKTPTWTAIEIIARTLSAARWPAIAAGGDDVYLHLYEHFLGTYDPEKRKKSGSYYTPVEVVDAMVRLTDDALKSHLGKPEGLRNPHVSIIDPAMGTGTYPLSVLRHVGAAAAQQYGPGAASEAVASTVARLYGIELQSGPFSVAELRVSAALRDSGAQMPASGLNLYVADTLEDPYSASKTQLSYTLQLIAKQRQQANAVKRERNIQVCIGNPPYKDHAGGMGGWIETGSDPATNLPPLNAFKLEGNGRHERHLSNLYAYFWRWATWKVFESTNHPDVRDGGSGVVCFITATGYLSGPGFRGMRQYLRSTCSHGWIINVTPEGKQPPSKNAVFNIETPVAIAMFLRRSDTDADVPADIRYIDVNGTRGEKFERLANLQLSDPDWQQARTGWTDSFVPAGSDTWDQYPAVDDLMPWRANGVLAGRGWVYGPSKDILEERLRDLVNESDPSMKSTKFGEGRDASLTKTKTPLFGDDVETDTLTPFNSTVIITDPKIVRVGYRSFDRQWLIADKRLIIQPSPDLWHARIPGQVFTIELHSEFPKSGPGLVFTSLIPDVHHFRGSGGGRALPMLHPDGTPNLAAGLVEALRAQFDLGVAPADVVYYLAAVCSHPGFVERFAADLKTPGVRVPITTNPELWTRAVQLGRHIVWLHTYGDQGEHPSGKISVQEGVQPGAAHPVYATSVGNSMPSSVDYDPESEILRLGEGRWTGVTQEVRDYTVGGANIIDSWTGYRLARPKGKRRSPLDSVNVTTWPAEWSIEFSDLLSVLTQLIDLEPAQQSLLEDILDGEVLTADELATMGVRWPAQTGDKDRQPRKAARGGLLDEA